LLTGNGLLVLEPKAHTVHCIKLVGELGHPIDVNLVFGDLFEQLVWLQPNYLYQLLTL
jgi:hypothetical protein